MHELFDRYFCDSRFTVPYTHLAREGCHGCVSRVSPYLPEQHSEEALGASCWRGRDGDRERAEVWAGLSWDLRDLQSWKLLSAKLPDRQIVKGMSGLGKAFRRQILPKI